MALSSYRVDSMNATEKNQAITANLAAIERAVANSLRRVKRPDLFEDAVADVVVHLLSYSLDRYDGSGTLQGFCCLMAKRYVTKHVGRSKDWRNDYGKTEYMADASTCPVAGIDRARAEVALSNALSALSTEERAYWDVRDLRSVDAAEALSWPTYKVSKVRARVVAKLGDAID